VIPDNQKCQTCRYAVDHPGGKGSNTECHKNPPVVKVGTRWGQWPEVEKYDWCGEWQPQASNTITGANNASFEALGPIDRQGVSIAQIAISGEPL